MLICLGNFTFRIGLFNLPILDRVMLSLYDLYKRAESLPFLPEYIIPHTRYDTIIDVGAGLGFFTEWMYRQTSPDQKIYSFEPDQDNCNILLKRVSRLDNSGKIHVLRQAISDSDGLAMLSINPSHFGDHCLERACLERSGLERSGLEKSALNGGPHHTVKEWRTRQQTETITLGTFIRTLPDLPKSVLLKLDVQGHEPYVLKGLGTILAQGMSCDIITEFSPLHLKAQGVEPEEFIETLSSNSKHCLFKDTDGMFKNISEIRIEKIDYTDIWCEAFHQSTC